ncbi:unnamed protein product [Malus baccata var. baccata]
MGSFVRLDVRLVTDGPHSHPNPRESNPPPPQPPPLHADIEGDNENVKQLNQCFALYLSLQVEQICSPIFY